MALSKTFAVGELLTAQDVNDHLVNAVPVQGAAYDTGWVDCIMRTGDGFAGSLAVRRVGVVVELKGSVTAGSMPVQNTVVAELPPGHFAPADGLARPAVYWTAAATDIGYVSTSGLIGVTNTTTLTRTSCQMRGTWLVG